MVKLSFIFYLLLLVICIPSFIYGQELASVRPRTDEDHIAEDIYVREQPVMTIHQESSYDPRARAQAIADKLNSIYSKGISTDKIYYKKEIKKIKENGKEKEKPAGVSIYWGQEKLITITDLQGKLNNSGNEELAARWVGNLQKAFSSPPTLKVFPSQILLAPGEKSDIKILGTSTGKLTWKINTQNIIEIKETDMRDRLVVRGINKGDSTVEFEKEGVKIKITVSVRENCVEFSTPNTISVSGTPCQPDVIRDAVIKELTRSISLKSGARLSIDPFNINPSPLSSGKELNLLVPVRIEGDGIVAMERFLPLKVRHQEEKFKKPVSLFVSDSPEKIVKDGIMFSHIVSGASPARLLYYHQNGSEQDKYLIIDLFNPYKTACTIWFISGTGGPNPQEAFVGHVATARFMRNCLYNSGQFFTIPPEERVVVYMQKMAPKEILTGLFHIQSPLSSFLELTIRAESKPSGQITKEILQRDSDSTHCRGVYPEPFVNINETYITGEPEKSIYIGKSPFLDSVDEGGPLYGNYGVLYDMNITIKNPSSNVKEVEMSFTSQGGIAQGTFLIDGRMIETPIVKSSEHVSLATLFLKGREERVIHVNTIPQGGSHYPV
ncbi:MAG: hypothetical protein ABRQ38_30185, partial [Candidatus Eremiobacterota bacterium]